MIVKPLLTLRLHGSARSHSSILKIVLENRRGQVLGGRCPTRVVPSLCGWQFFSGVSFLLFMWFVKEEIQPCESRTENEKEKDGRGGEEILSSPLPSPIVFCFNLGPALVPLLLWEPQKNTAPPPKKTPATQATGKLCRAFIPKYKVEIREGVLRRKM